MIAAAMAYALAIALLFSLAAVAAERVLMLFRRPQRFVWLMALTASVVTPCIVIVGATKPQQPHVSPVSLSTQTDPPPERGISIIHRAGTPFPSRVWPERPNWDSFLLGGWALSSVAMLIFSTGVWLRLRRMARTWTMVDVDGQRVWSTDGMGPAVFGFLRPRVIMPRTLLNAPTSVRFAVLAHERAHIAARDSLLVMASQLLAMLVPWNLPLWWQLRRLRFAVEVDCDARVLRSGLDPVAYGETLLAVGEHRSQVMIGAIALTEPVSLLERRIRIMMLAKPRHYASIGAGFFALAATFVVCATQLKPPSGAFALSAASAAGVSEFGKHASGVSPSYLQALPSYLRALVFTRYTWLFERKFSGTAMVSVILSSDGALYRIDKEMISEDPGRIQAFESSNEHFQALGVREEDLGQTGVVRPLPEKGLNNDIVIAYAVRKPSTDASSSKAIVEALVRRQYPDLFKTKILDDIITLVTIIMDSSGKTYRVKKEIIRPGYHTAVGFSAPERFIDMGLSAGDIEATGFIPMLLGPTTPNRVFIAFAWRKRG